MIEGVQLSEALH